MKSGQRSRQFASDNYAGMCPEVIESLVECNVDHAAAYGNDSWTSRAKELIQDVFETDCYVFFVFNGTAANSLVLASLCESYHSILCHELAHIETDECGAPEFFSNGTKLLQIPGANGLIDPQALKRTIVRRTDVHFPKPKVVSLTQATEVGTVYSVSQVGEIADIAKSHGLHLHMDGARFANAVVSLGAKPCDITWKAGVDALCFGGTKNGSHIGDAVVFFNAEYAYEFEYRCKQAGQLCSKMRFIAAPWVGLLGSNAWLDHARRANDMAQLLSERLRSIPNVEQLYPRQANSVFVRLPQSVIDGLRGEGWHFYTFIGTDGCRLMCSWDTRREDVEALAHSIANLATAVK